MKEIKAIIQPFMLTKVLTALHKIEGLPGVTISEVKGFGKTRRSKEKELSNEGIYEFVPKIKIEIVVRDELAETVVNTIQENAHTGNPGDGKIFVIEVSNVVKIRTNERGEEAI
ncbi:nitrogen regulatory protein P-II family [Candidatus Kryptonium thompsonii]|uniref:Nitrogen regulatory protein P-II family n=2 Tax=Candidatus Kryptonium thompsonii TaxID=1633631 RepID=A0A0P1LGF6_9BACT|nr:P-II family nitrogen regulator [Candidatus Kryptonium thompsoni]CUS78586.1 nitrogen regulatory protein P-II family [Candidatus Kryptonium thompsoni]CUS78773.1 nitrogen regulatory protein P-II family [Candidatus Kryptonium thompsoni]CUS79797.1 nitrogen regulatory protein P-II family [Candidatus Kryptonium thompsoni]CUS80377.1 nitrogen regulatory protein P-II family [Candidatus Kryptonium thompsoni]CUS85504.1 nitrogen regulatory protein P-II family [Candidatus Kryptonium thompsoni]